MPERKAPDWLRPVAGLIYLVGSFVIFYLIIAGHADLQWRDVAMMIVGALVTKSGTVIDWYFGSSQESSKKTEMMAKETEKLINNKPKVEEKCNE